VEALAFSRDGDVLVSGGTDGLLREWDVAAGTQIREAAEKQQIWMRSVAITADSKYLVSAGAEARVRVWDAATGEEVPKIQEHQSALHAVAFSPDGRYLATASRDTTLRLWDAVTGQELRVFRGHGHYVDSAVFSSDGKYLASTGYMDESVCLWDEKTGNQLLKLPTAKEGRFFSVAFTPDGKTLAAGGEWASVRRWEVPS